MDFKSFLNNKSKQKINIPKDKEKTIKENFNKYSKKSEKEVKDELFNTVAKERSKGNFSNKDLDKFYKQVAPMLDKNQKKKMDNLMRQLKK